LTERGEFDRRFDRTAREVREVSDWLSNQAFKLLTVSPHGITASATALAAEGAFSTTIAASPDDAAYANLTDPEIPD
jgi:hypothetical protein